MKHLRRLLKWSAAAIVLVAIGVGGYLYWHHASLYPSTDDAYVGAHVVHPATEVSGTVAKVPVHEAHYVDKGQLLFQLDLTPFKLAVAHAKAHLGQTKQQLAEYDAAVSAARAEIDAKQALLVKARLNTHRTSNLVSKGYRPKREQTNMNATLASAQATVALAKAKLNQAIQQRGAKGKQNASLRAARAELGKAKWKLAHATVRAPCAGLISSLKLRPGDSVKAGDAPFVLVCSNKYWVDANFKETDLERIYPGEKASISVDMYPDHTFHGRIIAVSGAAGTAFSLLPPENATGNWVKVTQRVPVRVLVENNDPLHPLRVGTSAEVTVDTTSSHTKQNYAIETPAKPLQNAQARTPGRGTDLTQR
jgi:membrane fusion protein (multidrug efflux system)